MKRFSLALLFLVLGVGLWVASVAVLVEASLVDVSLQRIDGQVSGTVAYRYYGIPVFWWTLSDLKKVEKREFQVADGAAEGGKVKRSKAITRTVFLNSRDKVIAWGERTALVQVVEPLQRYLESEESQFHYLEKPAGHPWDIVRERVVSGVFALTLVVGGALCVVGSAGQIGAYIKALQKK